MGPQKLLHLLEQTYVEHAKAQEQSLALRLQHVEVVEDLVSKQLNKALLLFNKFVEIVMELEL